MTQKILDYSDLKSFMEERGFKHLSDFSDYGIMTISNCYYAVIVLDETFETVFVEFNSDGYIYEERIEYDTEGARAYFVHKGTRYYLDRFMSMNMKRRN